LSSTVTDPGAADTFTYTWTVKKNGGGYATGSNTTFSFTPDDDGSYAVSLSVTDDDGGVGSTSHDHRRDKRVAPTPSILSVPAAKRHEGTVISLSSSVSDPGLVDTFTYAWTVKKNGIAYGATGSNTTFSFTPDDNGSYAVSLSVSRR
jgi:large repetitive protein